MQSFLERKMHKIRGNCPDCININAVSGTVRYHMRGKNRCGMNSGQGSKQVTQPMKGKKTQHFRSLFFLRPCNGVMMAP